MYIQVLALRKREFPLPEDARIPVPSMLQGQSIGVPAWEGGQAGDSLAGV